MKNLPFLLLSCLLVFSCKNEDPSSKLIVEIAALETEIGEDPGNAQSKIPSLLAKYEDFAALAQVDEKMKVDYLLRAGEMASLINQHTKSLGYYEKILAEYPDHPKAATAMFMKGYTLDDKLNKLDDAKAVYEAFLQKYPENDFADDTVFLLENLGKSEEEIIKQFEQKANGS